MKDATHEIKKKVIELNKLVQKEGLLKDLTIIRRMARVVLCIDVSAELQAYYESGKLQDFAKKILTLALFLDDDNQIDVFLFAEQAYAAGTMTLDNFGSFIQETIENYQFSKQPHYAKVIAKVRQYCQEGRKRHKDTILPSEQPVLVLFLTNGKTEDPKDTIKQLIAAAHEPIFWVFSPLE